MSEIFSWLKRSELDKRKALSEVVSSASEQFSTVPEKSLPEKDHSPVAAKVALSSIRTFDLGTADRRVRSVLEPQTIVGEQYRLLRAKLSLMQKQRNLRTLLVTSTVPNEGKTFTACCLAGVLAQEPGKRVLLIDADLRRPNAWQTLGLSRQDRLEGLGQVLRGEATLEDMLLRSADTELYFLPAGRAPANPSELLSSPNLERALKNAALLFDWVIVDSPPVLAFADTSLLMPMCDAALLVVHANKTPAKLVKDSVQRIGRDRICGVMMNRVRHLHLHRYYYQYYNGNSKKRRKK